MKVFVIKSHNLVKNCHENVSFCYKKSQPSYKKSHKTVNLCYKKSQSSEKIVTKM